MCQYLLSETYPGMFDNTKIINVFSAEAKSFEVHHIFPLLTAVSYGSSRKTPRSKK